ncbi:hypothetical protein DFH08DRAFT_831717 [Mycena albidolilacea]|uniref:F-box domain-containing protein n=1 Tax=Mycena albidolilacea TaxID=1033008 RepID=A0AAD7AVK3_9AGAR|nr:hypothetical protein DFH08DRAFT_831717 [Mycena albidolilacea]
MPTDFFLPQELVDECILHLSGIDLKACALVCRSWSHSAQRVLFRDVHVRAGHSDAPLSDRLEGTLSSSHLIHHIHVLSFTLCQERELDFQAFQKVCNIPFTHLEDVYIDHRCPLALQSGVALQQLLSLSTPRRAHLECPFDSTFLSIWDRCNVRHVSLACTNYDFPDSSGRTPPHSSARIVLESLRLCGVEAEFDWLKHDRSPLDLSRLVILSVEDALVLRWPQMTPAFQTIQALDVPSFKALDLSLFPNLLFLRLEIDTERTAVDALSTITTSSYIQQIVFSSTEQLVSRDYPPRRLFLGSTRLPRGGSLHGASTECRAGDVAPGLHQTCVLLASFACQKSGEYSTHFICSLFIICFGLALSQ